jgi:hypothetical protein
MCRHLYRVELKLVRKLKKKTICIIKTKISFMKINLTQTDAKDARDDPTHDTHTLNTQIHTHSRTLRLSKQ